MKIHKKIGTGLIFLIAALAGLLFVRHTSALPADQTSAFTASWVDRSTIQVTGAGKSFYLVDSLWDHNWSYSGSVDSCSDSTINGFNSQLVVGFGNYPDGKQTAPWSDALSTAKNFTVYYKASPSDTSCTKFIGGPVHINNWQNAQLSFRWDDSNHTSITRIDNGNLWKFGNPVHLTSGFDSGKTRFFRQSENGKNCQDVIDVSADSGTMWLYEQVNKSNGGSPVDPSNCALYATIKDLHSSLADVDTWHHTIPSDYALPLGEPFTPTSGGAVCADGSTPDPNTGLCADGSQPIAGGGGSNAPTCESSSSTALEWIMCPLFKISTALADKLIGLFQSQLCFRTDISSTGTTATCNGKTFSTSGIKPAWTALKNIASALLVIIMLIAVFSQAFSIGPIDAYTIRKLLPRLVAAVILIQISFYLFSWVINVVDDIGEGLMSLLQSIFPSDINNFYKLLSHAGVGDGTAGAASWIGFIGAIVLAVAALPTLLLMLFVILISLLVGLAVLIFRKVLIVALLIAAPVALLLWILPNTERYWKMWLDNFLKVLFMFPIIIMIIEAGRIFAWVAGAKGVSGGEFIGMFIVVAGFFGPLFILPKTYKWGGALMGATGDMMTRLSKPITDRGGAGLKGIGERWQGRRANLYNPQAGKISRGFRRLQSGHAIPFSERSRRLAIAAGDKWAAERNDEANALVNRTYEQALVRGYKDGDGKEYGPGVDAAKRALVDVAGQDTTNMFGKNKDVATRAAKSAVKQLLDTSSWIEMQGRQVSTGGKKGRRISELDVFRSALSSSPQHYGAVNRSRPDMAPDVIESAIDDVSKKYGRRVTYETATDEQALELDQARLGEALKRLTPENLQTSHYGLFQDITRVTKATGNTALADQLESRLEDFSKSGTIGQNAVGSLRGGSEPHVDEALEQSSSPRKLASFFSVGPVTPVTPTQQAIAGPPPPGEIRIEHGPESTGPGTRFPESQIYRPQERRTRPPE